MLYIPADISKAFRNQSLLVLPYRANPMRGIQVRGYQVYSEITTDTAWDAQSTPDETQENEGHFVPCEVRGVTCRTSRQPTPNPETSTRSNEVEGTKRKRKNIGGYYASVNPSGEEPRRTEDQASTSAALVRSDLSTQAGILIEKFVGP
ncbi:hypothetical protein BDV30DRAFT_113600 [Aspergillus minisclerotigenes]|uniref:Uncharacterized protein n=1 Tax=Aspergillus minisclerotigenes TaxID=656917 RepID=A0A5N6J3A3_9EURO|nr:hypothetical protein BDV30DRAFT_113600 [Aspergillus minisclerotigenes]